MPVDFETRLDGVDAALVAVFVTDVARLLGCEIDEVAEIVGTAPLRDAATLGEHWGWEILGNAVAYAMGRWDQGTPPIINATLH